MIDANMKDRTLYFKNYVSLIRLDKPIGTFLLLWPTLMALWIANHGNPSWKLLAIFITGVFLMRAAGCVVNDLADRKFDGHVNRTRQRPLATNKISVTQAVILLIALLIPAFCLALQLNPFCILLAFFAAALTIIYPFTKRFTHLPQIVLAITWNVGILMAFAASTKAIPPHAWLLYLIGCLWTIAYDTQYAMADREDDLKIGIKSTAILFGHADNFIITSLQIIILSLLFLLGQRLQFNKFFYLSLLITTGLFVYQYTLTHDRNPQNCLKAFLNNQWGLFVIFLGVLCNL